MVFVEYLGIVENKRRQGYASRFLRAIVEVRLLTWHSLLAYGAFVATDCRLVAALQDIEAMYAQQSTHPQALIAYIPQNDSFADMELFQSLGFQAAPKKEVAYDSSLLRMQMAWLQPPLDYRTRAKEQVEAVAVTPLPNVILPQG